MTTVSIITVCYNSEKTIEQTLQSVTSQNYPHIEYIIIDGGSSDNTLNIIEKYRDKIHLVISEKDDGIYHAMNKGIKQAKGDVIGLLNADDLYSDQEVISRIANAFYNPAIDACYGDLIYFSDHAPNKIVRYWQSRDFTPGLFSRGWSPAHPTFFVRKSIYEKHGVFDTSYSMGNDVELMMRLLEKDRIQCAYIPQVLVKMRLGGVSNSKIANIIEQNRNILQAAKKLELNISPLKFIFYKLLDRFQQFNPLTRSQSL